MNFHIFLINQIKSINVNYFLFSRPGGSNSKASAYNAGDLGSISGSEDSLEKEMATHSNTLAKKIPRTEKLGAGETWCRLLSTG